MSASTKNFSDFTAGADGEFVAEDATLVTDEVNNSIESTDQVLSESDVYQSGKAMADYASKGDYLIDSGVADAYQLDGVIGAQGVMQIPSSYKDGMRIRFKSTNSNTGASTVQIGALGAKNVLLNGSALAGGELTPGTILEIIYNGTGFDLKTVSAPFQDGYIKGLAPSVSQSEVPVMLSGSQDGYTVTGSASVGGNDPYKAYDGVGGTTSKHQINGTTGQNTVELPLAKELCFYKLSSCDDIAQNPVDWTIEVSATGAFAGEEVVVHTVTGTSWSGSSDVKSFTVDTPTSAKFYRMDITLNNGGGSYVSIGELTWYEGNPDKSIVFGTGKCRDASNTINITKTVSLVKNIDATWVAGSNQGGLADALTLAVGTTYPLFELSNADGTVLDNGFDTDLSAANLLTDANVIAAGLTKYRRMGSIITDTGSDIIQFKAFEIAGGGVDINYITSAQDKDAATIIATTNHDITVPSGIQVIAKMKAVIIGIGGTTIQNLGWLRALFEEDSAPSGNNFDFDFDGVDGDSESPVKFFKQTSTAQIMTRFSNTNCTFKLWTEGYTDERIA